MPVTAVKAKKVKTAKVTTVRAKPEMDVTPPEVELVLVKATREGYYAYQELMQERFQDRRPIRWFVGRDPIIRNVDEVFHMDAFDMKVPEEINGVLYYKNQRDLEGRDLTGTPTVEIPGDAVIIETAKAGKRVLPDWVELAEQDEEISIPAGHQKTHGKRSEVL